MRRPGFRATLRHWCYAALPIAACMIVPALYLMPNRKHGALLVEADRHFQLGFAMAVLGVALAVGAVLILLLGAEE